jgi:UDP-N-acetylmuramoyl-tripeptide--D-alanyl-D-alanine ligase
MKELGENSSAFHSEIIALTKELQLQGIFVGEEFKKIAQNDTTIMAFSNTEDARSFLKTAKPAENLILLKGSRSIGLENLKDIL